MVPTNDIIDLFLFQRNLHFVIVLINFILSEGYVREEILGRYVYFYWEGRYLVNYVGTCQILQRDLEQLIKGLTVSRCVKITNSSNVELVERERCLLGRYLQPTHGY